jgi:hypothetical protein
MVFAIAFLVVAMRFCSSPDAQDPPQAGVADPAPANRPANTPQARPPLRDGDAAAIPGSDINYYVVFDGSGSMGSVECGDGKPKLVAAVRAVSDFVAAAPATANIGLAAFDRGGVSERVALGAGNRDMLATALQAIRAGGATPLRTGIRGGYDRLTDQARRQLGYGEYHLIVVTDGKPEPASEDPTPVVREILRDSPVVLHTVGFCIDSSHVLNQPGRTFYSAATNPQELQQSLQAVLAEAPTFDVTRFQ